LFAQKSQIIHDQNKVITKKFTVQSKDVLKINTNYVKIVIEESEKNEIAFFTVVTLNKSTKEDMENLMKAIQHSNTQSGKTVIYNLDVDWSGKSKTNNLHGLTEIVLTIYAPKDIFYDLKVRYGDVKMRNIQNDFNATISYGNLKVEDMFGSKNNIKINYGNLTMEDLHGTRNQVIINYGNFKIFKVEQLDPGFVSSTWQEAETRHDQAGSAIDDVAKERMEAADGAGASDRKLEPIRKKGPKYQGQVVGKNSPCPCGTGKKYKACCGKK
jgi:hypothetical protein